MSKIYVALIALVIVSLFIRVYRLDSLPGLLNRDEAALAYNSLLLKETGKDEWGRQWPLALESFGDFKLLGYPLAIVLSFAVGGYSDAAVRAPSALAGVFLIVTTFALVLQVTQKRRFALLASLVIATTPIFFFYSRMAYEANLALALFVIALYWLLQATRHSVADHFSRMIIFDALAIFFVVLSVMTYNTPLILLPFFIIVIPWARGVFSWKRYLGVVIALCVVFIFFFGQLQGLTEQKSSITVFKDPSLNAEYSNYRQNLDGWQQKVWGNQYVYFGKIVSSNFISSFSPEFLVIRGGTHPWHSQPGFGHLSWALYTLASIGLIGFFVGIVRDVQARFQREISLRRIVKKITSPWIASPLAQKVILVYLLATGLLPSIITVDSPHATRSLLFLYVFVLLSVKGMQEIYKVVRIFTSKKMAAWVVPILSLIIIANFGLYLKSYFYVYPRHQVGLFGEGFDQLIEVVETRYPNQQAAVVDPGGYQYVLVTWYARMSPTEYFSSVVKQQPDRIGFRYGEQVSHYHFVARAEDRREEEQLVLDKNQDGAWGITQY